MTSKKTRPEWEPKVWGKTRHLFCTPHAAMSHLIVEKGSWCSKHTHRERANVFWCLSALVEIEEWELNGDILVTLLEPGDVYEVPSGVPHRFRVLEDGEMIEVYYADRGGIVSIDDIDREELGGRNG